MTIDTVSPGSISRSSFYVLPVAKHTPTTIPKPGENLFDSEVTAANPKEARELVRERINVRRSVLEEIHLLILVEELADGWLVAPFLARRR